MKEISFSFSGDIFKRGFWIYVWRLTHKEKTYYYVGRTGDSSSVNAASPMSRLTTHIGNNKKGNALKRHMTALGIEMEEADYTFQCFGPILDEKTNWNDHVLSRDTVATIESDLADALRNNGKTVLGVHQIKEKIYSPFSKKITKEILSSIE